jgi:hypothetical protein
MGRVATESGALIPQEETVMLGSNREIVAVDSRSSSGALTRITPDTRQGSQSLYDVFRRSRECIVELPQIEALRSMTSYGYGEEALSSRVHAASELSGASLVPFVAREHIRFRRAPKTLLFHINRVDAIGRRVVRIDTHLEVAPTFYLKADDVAEANEPTAYEVLYGASHTGGASSGHYTAVVKINGQWFLDLCLGREMKPIAQEEAMKRLKNATLVVMERRETIEASASQPASGSLQGRIETVAKRPTGLPQPPTPHGIPSEKGVDDTHNCCVRAVTQLLLNTGLYETTIKRHTVKEKSGCSRLVSSYSEKKRTCRRVREALFAGTMQPDPAAAIDMVVGTEGVYKRVTTFSDRSIGGIVRGDKAFVAVVNRNGRWYRLGAAVQELSECEAQNLLERDGSVMVESRPVLDRAREIAAPPQPLKRSFIMQIFSFISWLFSCCLPRFR